ncbi:hypothetical protein GQ53DRAFT_743788 [Thozetella sp. PMI_491]|nr:hypothetical protein GQ53DRAFT_743788 [Thozetella sp. PMI_491]
MPLTRAAAVAAIAAVGAVGVYGAFYIGFTNGLLTSIPKELELGQMAGCPVPFKMKYTDFAPLDGFLQNVTPFFCITIDGRQTWAETLSNWYLMAQLCAGWALICVEGLRSGNKGRVTGWTTLFGILFQTASYTLTVPLYLIFHLFASPVAKASPIGGADAILAGAEDLALVPTCVALALVVPTVMMALPTPGILSRDAHYNWIALWQGFPIWHALLFRTLKFGLPTLTKQAQSATEAHKGYLRSATSVYKFALAFAMVAHIAVLTIALTPATAVPAEWSALFQQVDITVLLPGSLISPPSIDLSGGVVPDLLAPLAAFLLKYDVQCGNAALLIWSVYLYSISSPASSLVATLLESAFWTVLGGPIAAALVLLWKRDEALLSRTTAAKS